MNPQLLFKLVTVAARHEQADLLNFFIDDFGELKCDINCSDTFAYACGDGELVDSEEDVALLEKSFQDAGKDGAILYCCRTRGMRPMGAFYSYIPEELWPLFNECGPEREINKFNPYAIGAYNPKISKPLNHEIRK